MRTRWKPLSLPSHSNRFATRRTVIHKGDIVKKLILAVASPLLLLTACSAAPAEGSDAYYACVDVMNREVVDGQFGEPISQHYAGGNGSWTITGTFVGALGDPVDYTCHATRVSDGHYSITWE